MTNKNKTVIFRVLIMLNAVGINESDRLFGFLNLNRNGNLVGIEKVRYI